MQGLVIVLMDIEVVEMLEQIVFNNLLPNSLLLSQTIIPDSAIKKVHTLSPDLLGLPTQISR